MNPNKIIFCRRQLKTFLYSVLFLTLLISCGEDPIIKPPACYCEGAANDSEAATAAIVPATASR